MTRLSGARALAPLTILFAVASGGVVVHLAGLPAPAVGNIGEDGPATEAALNNAEDVTTGPTGDIYVADINSSRLLRIRDGILTVAYRGDFAAGENDIASVAVASDDTVYFPTGQAILSMSPDGSTTEVAALGGFGQAIGQKLAIGPDDTLYVAGGRVPRIDRVEDDGTTTLIAGSDQLATGPGEGDGGPAVDARFSSISDLTVDSQGVIYVADDGFGDVRAIARDGTITTVFGAGTVPAQTAPDGTLAADTDYGSAEIGIAVDDSDRLYVVPRLAGKVFVVENGAITTVVGGGVNLEPGFPPLETGLVGAFRISVTEDEDILLIVEDGRFLWGAPGIALAGLIDSVPSPSGINLDPIVVAASLALTAGMLFLIPFPAEIFNNTLVEHHDQIRGWFRRDRESSTIWEKPSTLVGGLVVMALLYGFLDPAFGFNAASGEIFAGLLIGVVVTTAGFAVPTMIMRRRRTGQRSHLRLLPVALLVGVGCVLLSRLIGFVPGYLYGVALGLIFGAEVSEDAESSEVTATSVVMLVTALGSWFGLGWARSSDPGMPLVEAALAMVTVSAFEALVFGLLPIHGMPGRVLFRSKRLLWSVIWGFSVLAFFHVLVNPQSGYLVNTALVPVAATYGLLAFFTLVSLALWGWFRFTDRTPAGSEA